MATSFLNRLKTTIINNPGTMNGFVMGQAVDGFVTLGPGDDGKVVDILVTEGSFWELSKNCVYNHSTYTLSRGDFVSSDNGTLRPFTSAAQVSVVLLGERVLPFVQSGAASTGQSLTYDSGLGGWTNSNNPIPDQTGNSGKYLSTNGTATSWSTAPAPLGYMYGGTITTTPVASAEDSIAIGDAAVSSAVNSIAIGKSATCAGTSSLTIGANASCGSGASNLLIGSSALLGSPTNTLSIGNSISTYASYPNSYSITIGNTATNSNTHTIVIGYGANANGFGSTQSVLIGNSSAVTGSNSVGVGYGVDGSSYSGITCVGAFSKSSGSNSTSLGFFARASANGVAIGRYANAGTNGISIIGSSGATNYYNAIGSGTVNLNFIFSSAGWVTANNCILISSSGTSLGSGFITTPSNSVYLAAGGGNHSWGSIDSQQIAIGSNLAPRLFGQVQLRGTKGFENASNDSQFSFVEARTKTTNATSTLLWLNYTDYNTGTKRITLQTNSAISFKAKVIAISNANQAAWDIEGIIYQGANAASTVFIGTPVTTVIGKSGGASAWDIVTQANTTNGSLDLLATGAAATNIHWYAKVELLEIIV